MKYWVLRSEWLEWNIGESAGMWNQNDDLSTKKVEAYEESGEFPPDVEFVELETDVGWYGRHARKILRDQVTSFFGPTKGCKIFILPRSKLLVLVLRNGFVNSSPFLILYFFIQITLRGEIPMTLIPKCFVMCSLLVDLQSHEYPIYPIMLRISLNSP